MQNVSKSRNRHVFSSRFAHALTAQMFARSPLATAIFTIIMILSFSGCATQKVYTLSDDTKSVAHEQAYTTDAFQLDKGFESRDTDPQFMFFFKECELEKRRAHVSRIEYSCRKLPYQIY